MKKLLTVTLLAGILFFPGCGSDKSTEVPIVPDDAPPLAPTGLAYCVDNTSYAKVTWSPNTEADVAGYRVYVYKPSPRRFEAYELQNEDNLFTDTQWSCPIIYGQTIWVRVAAVDANGAESSASGPLALSWQSGTNGEDTDKPPEVVGYPVGGHN